MPRHTIRRGRSLNRNNRFRRTHRNNTRAKSAELRRKNNNSEEIGSGGFGIVSRPPARCDSFYNKNFNQNAFREAFYNPNYISKLTEFSGASHELEIGNTIREQIPNYYDYFCLGEFICKAPDSKSINMGYNTYDTYLVVPYCGKPFSDILREDIISPMNVFELCYLLTALQELIKGIRFLHLNHIFHKDIHDGNILYDSENYILRLIDFGLSEDYSDIKNVNSPIIINSELHDNEMIVDNIIMPYIEYLLNSRINLRNVRNAHPAINKFYYQIREFYGLTSKIKNPNNKSSYNNSNSLTKDTRLLNIIHQFRQLKGINYYLEHENNANNY
jgi:serine/threonine protein kinase